MRCVRKYILIAFQLFVVSFVFGQGAIEQTISSSEIYDRWVQHNFNLNYDSSMYYGDAYVAHQKLFGTVPDQIAAYNHKIKSLNRFGKSDLGYRLAQHVFTNFCTNEKRDNCIECDDIYDHLSMYMLMLEDHKSALEYLELRREKDVEYYYDQAKIYLSLNLPNKALTSTQLGITQFKKSKDPAKIIASYNQHGLMAESLDSLDLAITSFENAISVIDSLRFSRELYGYIIGNLGSCYFQKGELNKAYSLLIEDAKGSLKNDYISSYINTQILLAEIDFKQGDYNESIKKLTMLLTEYATSISIDNRLKSLQLLMQAYKAIGNSTQFDLYLNRWLIVNKESLNAQTMKLKELMTENSSHALGQMKKQMDIEKQLLQQTIITQEKEGEKKALKNWLILSLLIGAVLAVMFMFTRARKRALGKEVELELVQKEQALLQLKMKEESRNVQLLSHELIEKEEFSSKIINKLNESSTLSNSEIKNLELFIQNELDIKSSRVQLEKGMGELGSNFYNSLRITHPSLTESEVSLASMVAMKMTNKEIGISKNISTDSVKTTKNRLKKKMNLDKSQDMERYLIELMFK